MNQRMTLLAAIVAAGLLGLGLGRLPVRAAPDGTAAHGPLLVTSSIGATSPILFVLDPETRNLAAYEAMPGENGGLRLVGARKIEHDLELAKFRDLSEFSYFDLRDKKNDLNGVRADDSKGAAKGDHR